MRVRVRQDTINLTHLRRMELQQIAHIRRDLADVLEHGRLVEQLVNLCDTKESGQVVEEGLGGQLRVSWGRRSKTPIFVLI